MPDGSVLNPAKQPPTPAEAHLHNALLEINSDWSDWGEAEALKRVLQIAADALVARPEWPLEGRATPSPPDGERVREALTEAAKALRDARDGLDFGLGATRRLEGDELPIPTMPESRRMDGYLKRARSAERAALAAAGPSPVDEATARAKAADALHEFAWPSVPFDHDGPIPRCTLCPAYAGAVIDAYLAALATAQSTNPKETTNDGT